MLGVFNPKCYFSVPVLKRRPLVEIKVEKNRSIFLINFLNIVVITLGATPILIFDILESCRELGGYRKANRVTRINILHLTLAKDRYHLGEFCFVLHLYFIGTKVEFVVATTTKVMLKAGGEAGRRCFLRGWRWRGGGAGGAGRGGGLNGGQWG